MFGRESNATITYLGGNNKISSKSGQYLFTVSSGPTYTYISAIGSNFGGISLGWTPFFFSPSCCLLVSYSNQQLEQIGWGPKVRVDLNHFTPGDRILLDRGHVGAYSHSLNFYNFAIADINLYVTA